MTIALALIGWTLVYAPVALFFVRMVRFAD